MSSSAACQHGPYHECACYHHNTDIPNYRRDVCNPKTLQGYYAPQGGCPCHPTPTMPQSAEGSAKPTQPFRAADGPHTVQPASAAAPFPNSKNYGGTVAQRGATASTTAAQLNPSRKGKSQAKAEERAQDRKNFLKAILRDEMLARIDAEGRRAELEGTTGLMGSHHVDEYQASQRASGNGPALSPASRMASRGPDEVPTTAEQYGEIMDELEFVAGQPVGSKYNIIRLHYLVEESRRLNGLRTQGRQQQSAATFSERQKK